MIKLRATDDVFVSALATKWTLYALKLKAAELINIGHIINVAEIALNETGYNSKAEELQIGFTP